MVTEETATDNYGPYGMGCPHAVFPPNECIHCDGDGTEYLEFCEDCRSQTWHRDGKCLRGQLHWERPERELGILIKKLLEMAAEISRVGWTVARLYGWDDVRTLLGRIAGALIEGKHIDKFAQHYSDEEGYYWGERRR